jgi:hypothetical protein
VSGVHRKGRVPIKALSAKLKTAYASMIRFRAVGGITGWNSHDRAV